MKIKKSSWHYKVSSIISHPYDGDTLCFYFWRLVTAIAVIVLVIGTALTGIYIYLTSNFAASNSIMIGFIISYIALPWLIIWELRKKFGQIGRPIEIEIEIPDDNIVLEFIRAKKAKICPLIEYID